MFHASQTFGPYPTDSNNITSLTTRLDVSDTPTDQIDDVADALHQERIVGTIETLFGDRPAGVVIVHDLISDQSWVATGDHQTDPAPELDILAESGICEPPITIDELATAFPDRAVEPDLDDRPKSTDENALDQIAACLRTPEWFVSMLEDIAEIVQRTGRDLADEPDPTQWWTKH